VKAGYKPDLTTWGAAAIAHAVKAAKEFEATLAHTAP
jgi:hypothetical protein